MIAFLFSVQVTSIALAPFLGSAPLKSVSTKYLSPQHTHLQGYTPSDTHTHTHTHTQTHAPKQTHTFEDHTQIPEVEIVLKYGGSGSPGDSLG